MALQSMVRDILGLQFGRHGRTFDGETADETATTALTFDGDRGGSFPSATINIARSNDSGVTGRTHLYAPAGTLR
ncbi:MAG: hypothetical protein J6575_06180 [Bifidobacterium sp.]|nr:hypothetical protein [Bifidobacterium sp.]